MYTVNETLYKKFLRKGEWRVMFWILYCVITAAIFSFSVYDDHGLSSLLVYVVIVVVIGWYSFKPFSNAFNSMNRVVVALEISSEKITGRTGGFTVIPGLIKREPIEFEISKIASDIYETALSSDFNKRHFGQVYIIDNMVDQYYVGANLFDNFIKLKKELEYFVGHRLEEKKADPID